MIKTDFLTSVEESTKHYEYAPTDDEVSKMDETALPVLIPQEDAFKKTEEKKSSEIKEGYTIPESIISPPAERLYSNEYVSYNTNLMITHITNRLAEWVELGTEDAIVSISDIKDKLLWYSDIISHRSENRMLLSALELIFTGDRWKHLNATQVKQLKEELKMRFEGGQVEESAIKAFSKQLHKYKIISPMK